MILAVHDERFWANVDVRSRDECWEWIGPLAINGYGKASVAGKTFAAHRYAYAAWYSDELTPDRFVLHQCDNRKCVNPHHLRLGSHQENMREAAERGRMKYSGVTHCKNGHEFTPENTYLWQKTGQRQCRACKDAAKKRHVSKSWYRERTRSYDRARYRRRLPEEVWKDKVQARERYLRQNTHRRHFPKTLEPLQ